MVKNSSVTILARLKVPTYCTFQTLMKLSVVVRTCDLSSLGGWGRIISSSSAWPISYIVRTCLKVKRQMRKAREVAHCEGLELTS